MAPFLVRQSTRVGEGTKIGAIIGGLAGAAAAKKTKGKPVEVQAGAALSLTLTQGITVQVQE